MDKERNKIEEIKRKKIRQFYHNLAMLNMRHQKKMSHFTRSLASSVGRALDF